IAALLDLTLKPTAVAAAPAVIHETLAVTRAFTGCLGCDVLIDEADPTHVLVYERWDSPESDAAYRQFRSTPEGASTLGTILAAAPVLTKFAIADF
ncbi:MAG: putative quinol monooxygenase, partial [Janthinobacterium lividum]